MLCTLDMFLIQLARACVSFSKIIYMHWRGIVQLHPIDIGVEPPKIYILLLYARLELTPGQEQIAIASKSQFGCILAPMKAHGYTRTQLYYSWVGNISQVTWVYTLLSSVLWPATHITLSTLPMQEAVEPFLRQQNALKVLSGYSPSFTKTDYRTHLDRPHFNLHVHQQ